MSETVPGGMYLQGETLVDSEGKPVDNAVLEKANGALLAGLDDKTLAGLELTSKQQQEIQAERARKEREVELDQQPQTLTQLGQLLERAGRVVPTAQAGKAATGGVPTGTTTSQITETFEARGGKK